MHPTISVKRPAEARDEHDEYEIGQSWVGREQVDVSLGVVFDTIDDQYHGQNACQIYEIDRYIEYVVRDPVDEFARVREDLHFLRAVDFLARHVHHVDADHEREEQRDGEVEYGQWQDVKTAEILEEIVAIVLRVARYERLVVCGDCLIELVAIQKRQQQIAYLFIYLFFLR